MNLTETFKIYTGYPQQLARILSFVNSIDSQIGAWHSRLSEDLRRPSPFVLIFIQAVKAEKKKKPKGTLPPEADMQAFVPNNYGFREADTPDDELVITDKPITLSVSGEVPRIFSFQPDVAIANLQVAVICDVRVVRVDDICICNQHACPAVEAAPLAYHAGIVGPWHRITISTSLR